MSQLPASLPRDGAGAYTYFLTVNTPSVDHLKGLMFLEAGGQALYDGLAGLTPNEEVKQILQRSGREERAHAHRLKRVIKMLTGENVQIPTPDENPYHGGLPFDALSTEVLDGLMAAEFDGEKLYNGWADALKNDEVGKLLRQSGKEEARHGDRLKKVKTLLAA